MMIRSLLALSISLGILLGCASTGATAPIDTASQVKKSTADHARRCPASRPGRRQPALGIRCY